MLILQFACLLVAGAIQAQDATIEGQVILKGTDLPLEGVAIAVEGTSYGTVTNGNGWFRLSNLPAGQVKVVATSVGFGTWSQVFDLKKGQVVKLDIELEERVMDLPEAVVASASLTGGLRGLRNVPGSAHYLSPKDLQVFSYTDVNRVLGAVPGVNLQEEDGFGLRPNIGLRGSGSERSSKITLMEDGILAAPAPYAAPAAYYFPTIGRMAAVEILKGSSQVRFGPYTTGGAINFISTPIPDEFSGKLELSAGEFGGRKLHAYAGNSHQNLAYLVETFQYLSEGFKELDNGGPTGFDKKDFLAKVRLHTSPSTAIYQSLTFKVGQTTEASHETYLGLTDADFQATPYRRYAASQMDRMDTEHQQYSIQHVISPANHLDITTTAYYNKFHRNWYKLDKVAQSDGQKPGIAAITSDPITYAEAYSILKGADSALPGALEVKANNRAYWSKGVQTLLSYEKLDATVEHRIDLGLRLHADQLDRFQWVDTYRMEDGVMKLHTPGTPGTESNRIESATAFASYLQYKLKWGRLTFIPGLRFESITMKREDYGKSDPERTGANLSTSENHVNVWIPGVGLTWYIGRGMDAFAGIHKGFAPPGSKDGTKPEQSINYELGFRLRQGALTGQSVLFFNDYDNLLGADLAAGGGTGSGDLFNGGKAHTWGLELEVGYDLMHHQVGWGLPLHLSYTFTRAEFLSSFDSDFEGWGKVSEGDVLPYLPKHQLALQAGVRRGKFDANVQLRYQGEMRSKPGQGAIPASDRIEAFTVVDFSSHYLLHSQVTLQLTINNLTDAAYAVSRSPAGLRPGLPRTILGGVIVRF